MRGSLAPPRTAPRTASRTLHRSTEPGATVELAVLTSGRRSTIGVDLASGAFVRTAEPPRRTLFTPFTVVRGTVAPTTLDRPEQPELLQFSEPLTPIASVQGRRVERLIRPLVHPTHRPLLGFHGPSAPWWELARTGSVGIVEPERGPVIGMDHRGLRCRFVWSDCRYDLPLEDLRLLARLDWLPTGPLQGLDLRRVLGFRADRLVIALGRPSQGYCSKVVAGLLPVG